MYEFDKTNFLTSCEYHSLDMLYGRTSKDRIEAREKLLAFIRSLADSYEAAIESLNAIELAKSGGSESGETEDKENRPKPKSVCKFTWETMSDRCKRSLGKGCYYILIKPEVERIKKDYEKRRKEAVEQCFG
jgi:hypothetical protein